jgi:hypothetical protein
MIISDLSSRNDSMKDNKRYMRLSSGSNITQRRTRKINTKETQGKRVYVVRNSIFEPQPPKPAWQSGGC